MAQDNIFFSSWLHHWPCPATANQAVFCWLHHHNKDFGTRMSWQFSWWRRRQNRAQPAFPQLYWHRNIYQLKLKNWKQVEDKTFVCHVGWCDLGSGSLGFERALKGESQYVHRAHHTESLWPRRALGREKYNFIQQNHGRPEEYPRQPLITNPPRKSAAYSTFILFYYFLKFIYLFILGCLGLCCYTWAFSSCDEWGLLFVAVRGLLIAVASLVAECRL